MESEKQTYREKNRELIERQLALLDELLQRNAISKQEYEKSSSFLKSKMTNLSTKE